MPPNPSPSRIVTYVAAENAKEALLVCQSPSCRDKRQLGILLLKMHKHSKPSWLKKMKGWKLTITAERIADAPR